MTALKVGDRCSGEYWQNGFLKIRGYFKREDGYGAWIESNGNVYACSPKSIRRLVKRPRR